MDEPVVEEKNPSFWDRLKVWFTPQVINSASAVLVAIVGLVTVLNTPAVTKALRKLGEKK